MHNKYSLTARLRGHTDAILSLSISTDGQTIASGGLDRVRLWDLTTYEELPTPEQGYMLRGPPSTMVWAKRREDAVETLVFGTGNGYLVLWRDNRRQVGDRESRLEEVCSKRVASGEEITALSWDQATEGNLRLANGTRDGYVQLWIFNGKMLDSRFSIKIVGTIPKNLDFVDNARSDLYVFGTYNGRWHILRGADGHVLFTNDLNKVIGYVAVNVRRNIFVLDNTTSGFDLHQLDNGAFIRTFRAMISGRRVPKQVAFLEDAEVVVGGSDHGVIYIFDRRAGKLLDMLRHAEKGLLQTIATHEDDTVRMIVAASSDMSGDMSITIWNHHGKGGGIEPGSGSHNFRTSSVVLQILNFALRLLVFLAAVAFIFQNLPDTNLMKEKATMIIQRRWIMDFEQDADGITRETNKNSLATQDPGMYTSPAQLSKATWEAQAQAEAICLDPGLQMTALGQEQCEICDQRARVGRQKRAEEEI